MKPTYNGTKCSLLDGASLRRIVGKFDPAISALFLLPNISTFYIIIIIIIIIIKKEEEGRRKKDIRV